MRKLMSALTSSISGGLRIPADPRELCEALCTAMSERRGRPITLKMTGIPPEVGVTGLWLALEASDIVVVEERAEPEHQLVILGHELWHMEAGHCGNHVGGAEVAARALPDANWDDSLLTVAARTHFKEADESEAEAFGLLLGSRFRSWLAGPNSRGPHSRDAIEGRIEASLGYRRGLQG
ncbi:toxin-antitoxin system, toxin component [Streptomyces sp. NPDC000880]